MIAPAAAAPGDSAIEQDRPAVDAAEHRVQSIVVVAGDQHDQAVDEVLIPHRHHAGLLALDELASRDLSPGAR